jgi:hypothetical protein
MLEFRYQRRIQHGKGWRFRRPIMEEVGKIQGKVRSQAGILYCKTNLSKTSRRSKRETTFVIHHFFFFFFSFDLTAASWGTIEWWRTSSSCFGSPSQLAIARQPGTKLEGGPAEWIAVGMMPHLGPANWDVDSLPSGSQFRHPEEATCDCPISLPPFPPVTRLPKNWSTWG